MKLLTVALATVLLSFGSATIAWSEPEPEVVQTDAALLVLDEPDTEPSLDRSPEQLNQVADQINQTRFGSPEGGQRGSSGQLLPDGMVIRGSSSPGGGGLSVGAEL